MIVTSVLAVGRLSGINQPQNKVEDTQFLFVECCELLNLLRYVGVHRLRGHESPCSQMCMMLRSVIAVSVNDCLVRHPQELFVPFTVEQ